MRFAQQRISPNKQQNSTKCLHQTVNARLLSDRTYVHYNNGTYMGGMTSYKRNGQGILLLDDGSSIISEYCFDSMTGHNIIFRQNCIISTLLFKNGTMEIVVRTGQCIIKIPYYEKETLANGNGILVDYQTMKIYHLFYQSGKIVRKIVQSNRNIIDQVTNQDLHVIMDQRHEYALKLNLKLSNGIKVLKEGRRIVIGFTDNRNHLEGMGFKLKVNEGYDDYACPLEAKCIQRGFYLRNRLQNYGERYFSNGNLYIGEFQDDFFNGQGLLLYPQEQKWVWGVFEGQKLKKMLCTNLEVNNSKPHSIKACLKEIHEYNTKNWINTDIFVLGWDGIKNLLAETFLAKVTDLVIEKEKIQREEQERLGRIQVHFSMEPPGKGIDKLMEEQMNKTKWAVEKVLLPEYGSLRPKILEIEPRNTENQDYWSTNLPTYRVSPNKILTPSHSNWRVQDSRQVQSKLVSPLSRKSPNKTYSPYKRFHYPTNA